MNLPHLIHSSSIQRVNISTAKHELIIPKQGMLYMIMRGAVIEVLENNEPSKIHIKRLLGQGDIFPLYIPQTAHTLENVLYQTTVQGSIVAFSQEDFYQFLQNPSEAMFFYLQYIYQILQQQEQRIENKVSLSSQQRLINLLIQLAENQQFTRDCDGQKEIKNGLTQNQIGSLAMCSRQTVTQLLNNLESEGLLTYNRERILIFDIEKLRSCMS